MNYTFSVFSEKKAAAAAVASGETLQTDDRNVNIIERTENEPEG